MVSVSSVVASSTFTVYPGQAIAPFGMGLLGPLSVTGNLTLRGNTLMDISKSGATLASDAVSATGVVDLDRSVWHGTPRPTECYRQSHVTRQYADGYQ